ncbi:MAG: AsmA-like C-terminal region-containing protein [Candidatus Methylomirabilia bacterium]
MTVRKLTIATVILLILSGLVVLALLNLGRLVNRNKDYLLAQAEQALGRKVAVGDIGVTLWGGIGVRLKEFALADDRAFSSREFIRAADLQVNVELLPLLRQELRVKRLILHKPVITVIRDESGRLNFASLGRPGQEAGKQETGSAASPAATAALPFLVSLVDVADGEARYLDRKDGVDVRVSQLDLTVEDVGFDRPVSIDLTAAVLAERQNLRIKGRVGPLRPTVGFSAVPVQGEIELAPLNSDALQQALPQITQRLPQGLGLSGPLRANIAVSGTAAALTLSKVQLTAAVFGADKPNLQLTGRLGPLGQRLKDLPLSSDITLAPVALANLRRFGPLAERLPPDLSADGSLALSAHVEGTLETLTLKGNVEATASAISLGDRFRKPPGVPLLLSIDARLENETVTMQSAKIKLHTLELLGAGEVSFGERPELDLAVDSSRTELAGWEAIFPLAQGYDLSGGLEVHARIRGEMRKGRTPQANGSLTLTGLRATLPQLPQPLAARSVTVTFTGQRAALAETSVRLGNSQIRLAAQVERFVPPALTYRLSAPALWLADLRRANGSSKRPEILREAKSEGRVWAENGSLSYRGRLSSARGTITDVDYTNLEAVVSLVGQRITIERLALLALNGSAQGSGRYEYGQAPPRFTFSSKVRGLDLTQFFRSALAAPPKHIRGLINLDLTVGGSGTRWEDIHSTVSGRGQAEVVKGALLDVNIAEAALTGMTGVPGLSLFISPRMRSKYPAIFATRNTEFDQLKGSMIIRDGKVHLDDLLIAAADWAVRGKGWVTLDRTLDVRALLVLSRQLSRDLIKDVKAIRYLANRQGRVEIPFVLAGTLPGVTPRPDLASVSGRVQRGMLGRGLEELQKGVFKRLLPPPQQAPEQGRESVAPPSAPESPEKRPEEELLKGLKRLFGR